VEEDLKKATAVGPLGPNQLWTITQMQEVSLCLLRGRPINLYSAVEAPLRGGRRWN